MQRLIDTHPIRTYLVIVAIFAAVTALIGGKWTWFLLFGVLAPGYIVWSARQRARRDAEAIEAGAAAAEDPADGSEL